MSPAKLLLLISALAQYALPQQANPSPLGVLITPPHQVVIPKGVRSALPPNALVRLFQPTTLAPDGEHMIVYERVRGFEPDSHLAVLKNRRLVADFSLIKLFEKEDIGDTYALFSASQFPTPDAGNAFVAAFRNIGNGAGTLFVLVTNTKGRYRVIWQRRTTQGRLNVQQNGQIQLWDANVGDDCTWCPHRYERTTFEWKDKRISKLNHWTTRHALDPGAISARPIIIGIKNPH